MSQDMHGFFLSICKIGESPHKSYEHTWFISNSQFGLKSSIRAFSAVMRNTLLTTETKRHTLRTVNRRRPPLCEFVEELLLGDIESRIITKKHHLITWGIFTTSFFS